MSYHRATPEKITRTLKELKMSRKRIALEEIEYDEFKNQIKEINIEGASCDEKKD